MLQQFLKNVHALILREINTRAGSNPLALLWVIIEPILNVLVLLSIKLMLNIRLVENIDNALFVISGVVPFFAFQLAMTATLYGPRSNQGLLTFPSIKTLHIMMARVVIDYTIMLLVLLILLSTCYLFGITFHIPDIAMVIFYFTLIVIFGAGIGMFYAPLIGRFHFFDVWLKVIRRIMFFTSGVFISISSLPSDIQNILALNPATHMLTLLRHNLFSNHIASEVFYNWPYAAGFTMVTLFGGLHMIRKYESWAYETP